MMEYKVRTIAQAVPQINKYWAEHYTEVEMYQDRFPLDIDMSFYQTLEDSGQLLIVVGYDDINPIGYMVYIVKRHPRYVSQVLGIADIYWLHPDYRNKANGLRMFQFAEGHLRGMGVNRLIANCKTSHDHGKLLKGMGYQHFEESYTKLLEN